MPSCTSPASRGRASCSGCRSGHPRSTRSSRSRRSSPRSGRSATSRSRSTRRGRVASGSTSPTSSSTCSSGCSPSRWCSTCCGSRAAARSAASGSTSRDPCRDAASGLAARRRHRHARPRPLRDRPVARLHGRGADLTADWFWWTVPILVLRAPSRRRSPKRSSSSATSSPGSRELGVGPWATILSSAVLRGTYHLYQGFGPFVGNVAMGIVFGWCYQRWGRTMPLVIAHWILDIVSFVGYPLAVGWWPELFAAARLSRTGHRRSGMPRARRLRHVLAARQRDDGRGHRRQGLLGRLDAEVGVGRAHAGHVEAAAPGGRADASTSRVVAEHAAPSEVG